MVVGVLLQLVDAHVRQAADQQLQLGGGEDAHQLRRHEIVEARQEGVDLDEIVVT